MSTRRDSLRMAILTCYFPPENSAGANRLVSFARALKGSGIETKVIALTKANPPDLAPDFVDLKEYTNWVYTKDKKYSSFLRRFISEWKSASLLFGALDLKNYDFVLITSPFLSLLLLAGMKVPSQKLVVDIRDLTWEYKISRKPYVIFAQKILAFWATYAIKKARLVTASTPAEYQYLKRFVPSDRLIQISNGIESSVIDHFRFRKPRANADKQFSHAVTLLYAGTLGAAQGVSILIEVAKIAPSVKFVVIGDGHERQSMVDRVSMEGLANVTILGPISRENVLKAYSDADILFLRLGVGFETAIPSKAYEYLSTFRPIIYMGSTTDAAWGLLKEFSGTFRAEDGDPKSLVDQISAALVPGALDVELNRTRIANYTRESQAEKLVAKVFDISDFLATR